MVFQGGPGRFGLEARQLQEAAEEEEGSYGRVTEDGRGWLERRPRLGSALAIWGIVSGFLCLIVPGVVALRSVLRARRRGETPDGAWMVGLLTIWLAISAGIWVSGYIAIAILVGILGFFISSVLINRNPSRG